MTVRIMTARYAGRCKACAAHITPGDAMAHAGRGQSYCLPCADTIDARPDGDPTLSDRRLGDGYVRDPGEDMADRWNEQGGY